MLLSFKAFGKYGQVAFLRIVPVFAPQMWVEGSPF